MHILVCLLYSNICNNIDIYFIIELARNPPDGVSVGLSDDNLFKWELMIAGKFECHNIEYWTV